jgi:carboxypeptidase Q
VKKTTLFCIVPVIVYIVNAGAFCTPIVTDAADTVDMDAVARISDEGMARSQVMNILGWLTDVLGPRLTWSHEFADAAAWTERTMMGWGLERIHREGWIPLGRSWTLRHFSCEVTAPRTFPVIAYPKAWSPPTAGTVSGDAFLFDANTDSALQAAQGSLKGKFVLLSPPRELTPRFEPLASRMTDADLLELANADFPKETVRTWSRSPGRREQALIAYRKLEMCRKEGALGLLTVSKGDGGTVFVQGASVPVHPDVPRAERPRPSDPSTPPMLPQVSIAAEHYNRIARNLQRGETVRMRMNLDVAWGAADSGYNVIGEIPGTDLADELVLIGAHLDSWHGGTGTTDNGTGVATCMEAARIIKAAGLKPRRTIRICLWGGEEEGLLGSRAYVTQHFGRRENAAADSGAVLVLTPDAAKVSVYLNDDNGTGKIRGVFLQANDAVRPIFRAWLDPFRGTGATTLTLRNTGSTDHVSFDAIGIPAFQFIQDDIEYDTRTWHSTMDVFDRAVEDDLKQSAVIIATFAYQAAIRDAQIPRKDLRGVRIEVRAREEQRMPLIMNEDE